MRPIKLTMTAFGPYKETEVIDFNELQEQRLFVISGNTGAGKTTIFDGISFALYGNASGTDRENQTMLRSDFADDDTHTAVELIFAINERVYRVLRQLGHVKKGNKTKTGDRYELFEQVEGKEIPIVDKQIVSEIDKKIEEIIGITQDQFKQIVMLPQGEFRKLLTSQTENKEEILRRLFKTEPYKHISERLKRKKDIVEESFKREKITEEHYIQNIQAIIPYREDSLLFAVLSEEYYNINQIIQGLDSEISFYNKQITQDEKIYTTAYEAHSQKSTAFHQAKTLNDRFKELATKETALTELIAKEESFLQKENKLEAAERASQIEPYEKQAQSWRKDKQAKDILLKQANQAKQQAKENFSHIQQVYEQEENKQNKREEVQRNLDQLKGYLPTIQEIDKSKQQQLTLKKQKTRIFKQLEAVNQDLTVRTKTIETEAKKIKQMDEVVSQLPEKQETLINMREKAVVCIDYLQLIEEHKKLKQEVKLQTKIYQDLKEAYTTLENTWLNNQAAVLATHLHDGESCPVCGSHDHPAKAIQEDYIVTRNDLEVARKKMNEQEAVYHKMIAHERVQAEQIDGKTIAIKEYEINLADVMIVKDELVENGKKLRTEVDQLQTTRSELSRLKKNHEVAIADIKQLEENKGKLEQSYQTQKSAYERNKAVFEERLRVIPEDIRDLSKLEKMIHETEQLKVQLGKAWKVAQENLQKAKDLQTKTSTDLTNKEQQLEEAITKHEESRRQYEESLVDANFSTEESYKQAKLPLDERQQLKNIIEMFKQEVSTKKHQVKTMKEELKNQKKVDLTELEHELGQLKTEYELALHTLNQSKEIYKEAEKLKGNIYNANARVKTFEKELATITDLYDVIRGQNNPRISFERYLQIEYLEQIIDASNVRLRELSNGQFLLMRSNRQEARGRQSGLAFDVYDAYTGQTRDVKTLSGGEKFNTSLCLALGMSDVIQSFQGNISIDTMFIDEGFGSLDEESLHKSIDTLIDLQQSGRMIGVISHVEELKSIFPAILEVKKTKEGYSQTKFVVK